MAKNNPRTAAIRALTTESPISPAMIENANIIRAKISTGPICNAIIASGTDKVIKTISLKVSPVTDEYNAIFIALTGFPFFANG